ncbi:MAG: cytochrome c [Verrucomicrobia bacterium]|nr:cytochrome c [Verrucomicrobiota bacterium]
MSKKKRQSETNKPATSGGGDTDFTRQQGNRSGSSEPTADCNPIHMGLIVLLSILLFAADMQLMAHRGGFEARVYEPYNTVEEVELQWPIDPAVEARRKGKRVYDTVCTACHQGNGLGTAGQFPPLAGSDWVNEEGPNRLINLVLHGIQGPMTVNGQAYNNAMPPWGPVLKDDEVAAVVTYIRSEWGNKGSAVTPEQVAPIRQAGADRGPWSADELLKVPVK